MISGVSADWMASGEGREFMALSGEGWRTADVAAGAEPAEAGEAARRTIAFYAGTPSTS